MKVLLEILGFAFGAGALAFVAAAFASGARGVKHGGSRLLFRGYEWYFPSDRIPAEARPHLRATVLRWLGAMACLALAAGAAALSKAVG